MHYVILSEGAYSDYSPNYFYGPVEITQEQFDKKGAEIGDQIIEQFENLPTRPHVHSMYCYRPACTSEEKYWPDGKKSGYGDLAERWFTEMEAWLQSLGFTKVPDGLPEINVSYSDIPNTKNI